jgi:hypothetical protein
MVEIVFSANPGVFEVDIEEAAIDAESSYLLNSSSTAYKITVATARPDGTYVAWAELQPQGGAFLRLNMVALANVVTTKAKVVYV